MARRRTSANGCASMSADFEGCTDVLDIGCGRGEFLDAAGRTRYPARGASISTDEMVPPICRDRGLDATTNDALSHSEAQADGSLGGAVWRRRSSSIWNPDYLLWLLEVAHRVLRPGSVGRAAESSIRPVCFSVSFRNYIQGITDVRPLHPDTLRYFTTRSGSNVSTSPLRIASSRMPRVSAGGRAGRQSVIGGGSGTSTSVNADKLERLDVHRSLTYAVIARRA